MHVVHGPCMILIRTVSYAAHSPYNHAKVCINARALLIVLFFILAKTDLRDYVLLKATKHETGLGSTRAALTWCNVQDSVGISLFATKNKVKREERRMTLLPQVEETHSSDPKQRIVSSRRCQ